MNQNQFDLEKAKEQLKKLSREASILARKGEKELIKLSVRGKLHLDSTTTHFKLEHLCYLIGKEYVTHLGRRTSRMTQLVEEHQKLAREENALKAKLKKS